MFGSTRHSRSSARVTDGFLSFVVIVLFVVILLHSLASCDRLIFNDSCHYEPRKKNIRTLLIRAGQKPNAMKRPFCNDELTKKTTEMSSASSCSLACRQPHKITPGKVTQGHSRTKKNHLPAICSCNALDHGLDDF